MPEITPDIQIADDPAAHDRDIALSPAMIREMLARSTRNLELAKAATDPAERARYFHDAIAGLPPDSRYDPETGQIRDKTWWERHGETVINLAAGFGGVVAAGLILGPANAATLQAATSSTPGLAPGLIDTALPTTAPASAAVGGSGTLASLSTRGGPNAEGDPAFASSNAPAAPSPEPAAVSGVPGGTTSLPGSTAAPSVGPDLVAGGSAVPGQVAGVTAPAASTIGSVLSNPLIGGLITAGLQFAQSKANADAAKTASQQEIDAANKALDLQNQQFNLSRGDYLSRQAYTQQQIGGLAPYQDIGTGALANLRSLTGQPSRPGLANTPPVASLTPPVVPSGTLSSLTNPADNRRPPTAGTPTGQIAQPRMITLFDPTSGVTVQKPANEEQHWTSLGAQRIA
jgi:hypothetical protein